MDPLGATQTTEHYVPQRQKFFMSDTIAGGPNLCLLLTPPIGQAEISLPKGQRFRAPNEQKGVNLCTTLLVLPLGQSSILMPQRLAITCRQEFLVGLNLPSLIPILTMFGGLGQPLTPPLFPNPPKYAMSPGLRTQIEQNRLSLRDTMFGVAGEPLKGNPIPNPMVFRPSITLLSHLDMLKLNLIGKDTFFSAAGIVPIHDWPNPKSHNYSIELRTFLHATVLELINLDQMFDVPGKPSSMNSWQIPQLRIWPHDAHGILIYEPPLVIVVTPPTTVVLATAIINELDLGPISIVRFIELLRNQ